MFKREFDAVNGVRITMKPPRWPCKLGFHIQYTFGNEYELYFGHIVDTNNANPSKWQDYELPLVLLHNDAVMSKLMRPNMEDDILTTLGCVFKVESTTESEEPEGEFPLSVDLQKVDLIYNPEYDKIADLYKIPVFFKSDFNKSFLGQGFIDNGRHKVPLKSIEEYHNELGPTR